MAAPLYAAFFSFAGYLTGIFVADWRTCLVIAWTVWLIIKAGAHILFVIPPASLDPPYINVTLDLHYALIYTIFSIIGCLLVKYTLRIPGYPRPRGPLERLSLGATFLIGIATWALVLISSAWLYARIGYPWNYIAPAFLGSGILGAYFYNRANAAHERDEYRKQHKLDVHHDKKHHHHWGITHLWTRTYAIYSVGLFIVLCMCQFLQLWTLLSPDQELYAQYVAAVVLAVMLVVIPYFFSMVPNVQIEVQVKNEARSQGYLPVNASGEDYSVENPFQCDQDMAYGQTNGDGTMEYGDGLVESESYGGTQGDGENYSHDQLSTGGNGMSSGGNCQQRKGGSKRGM
jgi:hypothetical protein